jgi:hypothetical protein
MLNHVEKLKVMVKPREVYVRSAFKKNELVLVPITLKVDHKKVKDDEGGVSLAAIDVGVCGDVRLFLRHQACDCPPCIFAFLKGLLA